MVDNTADDLISRIKARRQRDAERYQRNQVYRAMRILEEKWGKFPRKSLTVIACTFPKCDHHCIYRDKRSLGEQFDRHARTVHQVKPTERCLSLIESKVKEFQSLKYYPYLDPFLYVSLEAVTS